MKKKSGFSSNRKGPREKTYPSAREGGNYRSKERVGSSNKSSDASSSSKPRYKKRNDDTSW